MHRNKHRKLGKMKRQRNAFQMKEQDKTLEKELKEMEIINLLDKEFKIIAYRSYQTWTRMYKLSENFNKEIENIKKLLIRTEEYNN